MEGVYEKYGVVCKWCWKLIGKTSNRAELTIFVSMLNDDYDLMSSNVIMGKNIIFVKNDAM